MKTILDNIATFGCLILVIAVPIFALFYIGKPLPEGHYSWFLPIESFILIFCPMALGFGMCQDAERRKRDEAALLAGGRTEWKVG